MFQRNSYLEEIDARTGKSILTFGTEGIVDLRDGLRRFPRGSPFGRIQSNNPGKVFQNLIILGSAPGEGYLLWDYDNTSAPQLTTVRHAGRAVDAVALAGKTGFLYVFNRVTGAPLWPIEERPVPKSDMPGEHASPTQPFPTAPPPFAVQKFTADDINPHILTPEERAHWKQVVDSARNEGIFTSPSMRYTIQMPGNQGGSNWGTTSSNPTSQGFVE